MNINTHTIQVSPWPIEWWGKWYYIQLVIVRGFIIGVISTVWFSIGGTYDFIKMFKDLAAREVHDLDDGSVTDHIGANDIEARKEIEQVDTENSINK